MQSELAVRCRRWVRAVEPHVGMPRVQQEQPPEAGAGPPPEAHSDAALAPGDGAHARLASRAAGGLAAARGQATSSADPWPRWPDAAAPQSPPAVAASPHRLIARPWAAADSFPVLVYTSAHGLGITSATPRTRVTELLQWVEKFAPAPPEGWALLHEGAALPPDQTLLEADVTTSPVLAVRLVVNS